MPGNDDYGVVREEVLAKAREQAQMLASQGLPAHEIEHRLDPGLTATERELLWGIAKREAAAVRTDPDRRAGLPEDSKQGPAQATAGGSLVPALGKVWEEARRRTKRRLDRGWAGSVPTVLSVALAGAVAGLLIGWVIAGGSDQGAKSSGARVDRPDRPKTAARDKTRAPNRSQSPSATGTRSTPSPAAPAGPAPEAGAGSQPAPANAATLNDRGFQLMNAGHYQDAIALLRRAVSSAGSSGDMTYAYALYNLGRSLRLAGRADEAIPLLERRLRINNQRATVVRELKAARRSAYDTGGSG